MFVWVFAPMPMPEAIGIICAKNTRIVVDLSKGRFAVFLIVIDVNKCAIPQENPEL